MSLPPGTRLGPYLIEAPLGAGGMGEVYKARDTRLERTVAVKVLAPALAADSLFRERFAREAKTISAFSDPHICTLYDIGRENGVEFLVMEYLEGETLAERISRGPVKVDDALGLAVQIARALERAHHEGIVHRDLKPGNIMLVRTGSAAPVAKLLDFGLAKQAAAAVDVTVTSREADATRALPMTAEGTILGTFQYMAPELVEGREADARTDIWAFGCLLYEMLTGRPPFEAATQAGIIAAILERQPRPIDLTGSGLAPGLQRAIGACLEKNPDDRFQTVRDVRREIEWLPTALSGTTIPAPRGARASVLVWAAVLGGLLLIAATAAVTSGLQPDVPPAPPAMFSITLRPQDAIIGSTHGGGESPSPSVSPDGTRIAFIARSSAGDAIWLRQLGDAQPRELKGTIGGRGPFWSPDAASIGFFAGGRLKTIELATEKAEIVCDAAAGFGGTWGPDGTILFSPDERSPIYKVSATGGAPAQVTTLDASRHDQAHRWPKFLPDGRHFVYMPWTDGTTTRAIQLASLDGARARTLLDSDSAVVVAGDYLLYVADLPSRLMAWRINPTTLQMQGTPFAAVPDDNVDYNWMTGEPGASAGGGTLVYTTGKTRTSQLTWLNRSGRPLGTVGEPGGHLDPRLSPDGTMVVLERNDRSRGSGDIWTLDPARNAFSRLTSAPGFEATPIWSPDGRRVLFSSDQGTGPKLYVRNANGTGNEEVLVAPPARSFPTDWSADGRHVLFMLSGGPTKTDIWTYDVERHVSAPLVATGFDEGWAMFSPDGKWIAYVSDENQQRQVYVRSFPDGDVKTQLSIVGGGQPQWRGDGRELYYIAPDNTLMAVGIQPAAGRLSAGAPQALFTANVEQSKTIRNQYAASADGQRFLILSAVNHSASPLVAVLNWRSLIRK